MSLYDDVTATASRRGRRRGTVTVDGPGRRRRPARRRQPGGARRRAPRRSTPASAPECTCTSARASRWPAAWPAARADAAAALVACDALWGTGARPRRAARARRASSAPTCRSRCSAARRSAPAAATAHPGAGPRRVPLGARARRRRAVDAGRLRRVDRLRTGRRPARAAGARRADAGAAGAATPRRVGALLANDLQTRPSRLRPTCDAPSTSASEYGALGGIVSGSGPTVAFLARDAEHALDLAVALTASGRVPRSARARTVRCTGARVVDAGRSLMAHLVNVEGVTVAFGTRTLLDGVSLGLDDGDRVGVVGRNGDGKSTLLRVLARPQPPDGGRVTHSGGLRVGLLAQTDELDPALDGARTPSSVTRPSTPGPRRRASATSSPGCSAASTRWRRRLERVGGALRRRAPAGRAGRAAASSDPTTCCSSTSRRTTSTSRASPGSPSTWRAAAARRARRRHPRPVVPRRGLRRATWEVADGAVHAYDGGYAAYVLARAERTRVAGDRGRAGRTCSARSSPGCAAAARPHEKPRFRIDAANALIADEPPPRDGRS